MVINMEFIMYVLIFSLLLRTKMTNQFTSDYFDRNHLETYLEEISEQNNTDIFVNLTFHFTCKDKPPGFYADIDYNCRIFHVCENSSDGFPVICSDDTVFDQKMRICTDKNSIDCQHSDEWYYLYESSSSSESRTITEKITEEESKIDEEDIIPSVLPLAID